MAEKEAERADGIDFVIIVTPNSSHFEICKAFLEAGIHVVCDKPVTTTYAQAVELNRLAKSRNLLFMVTYTYMGNVTVKYARELVRQVLRLLRHAWRAIKMEIYGKKCVIKRTLL